MNMPSSRCLSLAIALAAVPALFGCEQPKAPPSNEELHQAVRRLLDPTTAETNMLDQEGSMVVASGTQRRFYATAELDTMLVATKGTQGLKPPTDFNVVSETVDGSFASITYRATWHAEYEGKVIDKPFVAHEIWDRRLDQWHRVYATIDVDATK
jgi:hypothetical protein